jgi:hypothetical protein
MRALIVVLLGLGLTVAGYLLTSQEKLCERPDDCREYPDALLAILNLGGWGLMIVGVALALRSLRVKRTSSRSG